MIREVKYPVNLKDIISSFLDNIEYPVLVEDVTDNEDGTFTLLCDDVYHAQAGFSVTIDETDFLIQSVTDTTITLVADSAPASFGTLFNLYKPFFFHGTPLAEVQELGKINDQFDKTPFVWLMRTFSEKYLPSEMENNDRMSNVRLLFLTQANHDTKLNNEIVDDYVQPMRKLMFTVLDAMRDSDTFDHLDDNEGNAIPYTVIEYPKLGVYQEFKGMVNNILADKLSGCEVQIVLPISKNYVCD